MRTSDGRDVRPVFIGLMLGMFVASLNQTIIAPALPRIVAELGGLEHYSWVAVSALVASTVVVPLAGKLSDLYGRKPFYVGGIVLFSLGSLLAGFAPNLGVLIGARVVQGIGMGTVMPLAQAIIGDIVPPRERGKYQGLLGASFGLSSILGPLIGGYLTDNLSWRWLFFVNVPAAAAALVFIVPFMHVPHVRRAHAIDYLGIVTLSFGLTAFLLATVLGGTQYAWDSVQIVGLYAAAFASLGLFVRAEASAREPILPLRLWRNPIFTFSNLAGMFLAMGMFGGIFFIPLFIQGVIGSSATSAGAILIPMSLTMIAASVVNGQIISRWGRYKPTLVLGLAVMVFGFVLLAQMDVSTGYDVVVRNMVLIGLGLGAAMQTFTLIVQNAVEHTDMGVATAATQLFRSIGSTVGIAVLGTLLTQSMAREIPQRLPPGAERAFQASGGAADAGALLDPSRLAQLPAPIADAIRSGLSVALHDAFLAAVPLALAALVFALFIGEIPLRRTIRPTATEAGKELLAELGQSDEDSEPELGESAPTPLRPRVVGRASADLER